MSVCSWFMLFSWKSTLFRDQIQWNCFFQFSYIFTSFSVTKLLLCQCQNSVKHTHANEVSCAVQPFSPLYHSHKHRVKSQKLKHKPKHCWCVYRDMHRDEKMSRLQYRKNIVFCFLWIKNTSSRICHIQICFRNLKS